MAKKTRGGSAPKFTEPEAIVKIQEYLAYCKAEKRRPTAAGLGVFMGLTKETVLNYVHRYKDFAYTYELMKMQAEDELCQGKSAMDIFLLKAIFGYQDKVIVESKNETKSSGELKINFTTVPDVDVSKYTNA